MESGAGADSLLKFIGYKAFDTLWQIIEPQLPGVIGIAGFAFGSAFILGLVGIFLNIWNGKMEARIKER